MTAQQQLASILSYFSETGHVPATAVDFLRDHGSAIAELIEAAEYAAEASTFRPAADRLYAALRKLTQEAR